MCKISLDLMHANPQSEPPSSNSIIILLTRGSPPPPLYTKSKYIIITDVHSIFNCPSLHMYVYLISDGAASQYKNRKNFINLCNHKADFDIAAEWHFSATSHGKGACDGLGGTVKRLAAKAILQRPFEEQIQTPLQLYEWASSNLPGIFFVYCTTEEYSSEAKNLEERFEHCRTVPGTRQFHCFVPQSSESLLTKRYSTSSTFQLQRVAKLSSDLEMEEVAEYVTCVHESQWWLAQVLQKDDENNELKLSLLSPNGPSRWYKYPYVSKILHVPITDVLTVVQPHTTTGRSFSLSQSESKAVTQKLKCLFKT